MRYIRTACVCVGVCGGGDGDCVCGLMCVLLCNSFRFVETKKGRKKERIIELKTIICVCVVCWYVLCVLCCVVCVMYALPWTVMIPATYFK